MGKETSITAGGEQIDEDSSVKGLKGSEGFLGTLMRTAGAVFDIGGSFQTGMVLCRRILQRDAFKSKEGVQNTLLLHQMAEHPNGRLRQ